MKKHDLSLDCQYLRFYARFEDTKIKKMQVTLWLPRRNHMFLSGRHSVLNTVHR